MYRDPITDPKWVRVVVPLRIPYTRRDELRKLAEDKGVSVNQFLLDTLYKAGVDLS